MNWTLTTWSGLLAAGLSLSLGAPLVPVLVGLGVGVFLSLRRQRTPFSGLKRP